MASARERYDLYERAAQSPERQARFLQAVAPGARVLGEDGCGAGSLSIAWAGLSAEHRAAAVDLDPEPLEILREKAERGGVSDRVETIVGDIREVKVPVDLIALLNFSVGYFHERADLLGYLRRARSRLEDAGGTLVCDLYGGADAWAIGRSELELRGGVRYEWEQREADPLTGRVVNAMHFERESGERIEDAFVYEWRLWGVPELRDAMLEAGFAATEVYDRLGDATLEDGSLLAMPASGDEVDENFVVYVAARLGGAP
jgi:ubiquinone/menaquinone biosynthesis C-methylase UbiE